MIPRRGRRLVAAAAALVVLGVGAAACSAGTGSDDADGASSDAGDSAGSLSAPEEAPVLEGAAGAVADDVGAADPADVEAALDERSAVIRTGNVGLRADDVGAAVFGIRKAVVAAGGEISEENTEADAEGAAERSLMTLRVPEAAFTKVVDDLKGLEGTALVDATTSSADVGAEVIDVGVRVDLQKRSIERISVLLDRATSIPDVMTIESELARREADLGSLQERQAYLADQTAMSTLTVSVERPLPDDVEEERTEKKDEDDAGFVSGLEDGWSAFTTVASALLTVTGAVLPFAVVLLVLGVPAWVVLRRRRPAPDLDAGVGQSG